MPRRRTPITTGYTYHVFNKTIDKRRLFDNDKLASHMLELFYYYRSTNTEISYSHLRTLRADRQSDLMKNICVKKDWKVDVLAYCLMPTHFHLLLRQRKDNGISKYLSDAINAFTRHFNILMERKGPVFLPKFQAVCISSRDQLIHVSRYIHLNPYSSKLVKKKKDLDKYEWSSFSAYSKREKDRLCQKKIVMGVFKGNGKKYVDFVLSDVEYQKTPEYINYASKW